jgi:hypothetical protein
MAGSSGLIVIEGEPPDIARGMHDMQDDGLALGDTKVDVVAAVNREPQAGADRITRHARVAELGDPIKMIDDLAGKPSGGFDAVVCDEIEDFVEIGVSQVRDDQLFRRDLASPREMISAFMASALGDF